MHLLDPAPFGRILPAMVTPMKADGAVDFEAAQQLARQLVADGADGLVVNGTTGESPTTHMEEKVELVQAVKEVVDVPVISGAGSNDTAHTVRMVEQTQEAGADAVLVVAPYYSRPSQEGVFRHYKAVNDSADKPIIVYDVPGRTGLHIQLETYRRMAELDHVKAVKDATGGFNAFKAETLRGIDLDEVASAGYCFQIDLVWRTVQKGYAVTEVPIEFVEREFGDSKMSRNIVVEALVRSATSRPVSQ